MRHTEISILPVDHLKCHLKHIIYCFISLLLMEMFFKQFLYLLQPTRWLLVGRAFALQARDQGWNLAR